MQDSTIHHLHRRPWREAEQPCDIAFASSSLQEPWVVCENRGKMCQHGWLVQCHGKPIDPISGRTFMLSAAVPINITSDPTHRDKIVSCWHP